MKRYAPKQYQQYLSHEVRRRLRCDRCGRHLVTRTLTLIHDTICTDANARGTCSVTRDSSSTSCDSLDRSHEDELDRLRTDAGVRSDRKDSGVSPNVVDDAGDTDGK